MNTDHDCGKCWNCGADLSPLDYTRGSTCDRCGRDTRVCKGCQFYDPSYNNECRESQADRVVDKEKSNFCDYFKPKATGGNLSSSSSREALRASAEALFKKKS